MRSDYDAPDDAIVDINMTPFVDVVLVLLVIFMVAQRAMLARGVDILKPTSVAGTTAPVAVRLSVDATGAMFIGEAFVTEADAPARLRAAVAGSDPPVVLIAGDKRAAYEGIMRAVGAAHAAGIHQIKLENVAAQPQ